MPIAIVNSVNRMKFCRWLCLMEISARYALIEEMSSTIVRPSASCWFNSSGLKVPVVNQRADRNAAKRNISETMNSHRPMRFAFGWKDVSW